MKKYNKFLFGFLAVAAIAGVLYLPSVSAYQGDRTATGPNHTEEREAAMESAMLKKDFATWKALLLEGGRKPGVLRIVDTQAEFDKFVEAWKLKQTGNATDSAKADQIRFELGLGLGAGARNGNGNRGQNRSGNFVDNNHDGVCDAMQ